MFTYRNLGTVKDKGIELGVDASVNRYLNVFVNYSYQADPESRASTRARIETSTCRPTTASTPASTSTTAGTSATSRSATAARPYWQDVLDQRYAGTTDAFTLVNGAFGVRWVARRW